MEATWGSYALRRKFLLAFVAVLACGCGHAKATPTSAASSVSERTALRQLGSRIARHQQETWHWQRLMGLPLTETEGRNLAEMNVAHVRAAVRLWQRRAAAARRRAQKPPNLGAWLCIHRYEGRWDDPAPPYYGGLQMDISFQRHYAPHLLRSKGTADRWTPLEQIWVAEKARRSGRGFYPWPNTARYCGLI
jgi:hypothetical protein